MNNKTQCCQIMLESGADLSLKQHLGTAWLSGYEASLVGDRYATFRQILLLGQPFINTSTKLIAEFESKSFISYPLIRLAEYSRKLPMLMIDILEKAILLLRLNADITVVDEDCNNILHCALMAKVGPKMEGKETQAKEWMEARCDCDRCNASFREPRQLLTAAIAAGADIYAFNEDGATPTLAAEQFGREAEWVDALEECGIDVEQVLLHTEEWEKVLDELDIEFWHCSSETRAKIVEEFESSFWNPGKMRQESKLTFQQSCEQRDSRRKLQVECDYVVATRNYDSLIDYLRGGENFNEWSEEESQRSSEIPDGISENALSNVEEELKVHQDLQLAGTTDTFIEDMEEDGEDGVIDILDDLRHPVEHDDVFDIGDVHGSNRDLDMAKVYWGDDPFDLGSNFVGSPVISFGEFMTIDEWNDGL
ncbi:hypothetical protein N431DRAFT_433144 [Stipitochalara longipes BDJ]|nr:hypothetical protein N431DRAFT_433144 [Stipitochalara longipes BDJ]